LIGNKIFGCLSLKSQFTGLKEVLEIIADNLKKAGWSLGWVSAVDSERQTIWIFNAHRDNGKRFVAHADES
jgi:hypothetical protein